MKRWTVSDGGQQTSLDGLLELTMTVGWLVCGLAQPMMNCQVLVYQVSEIAPEMTTSQHVQLALRDQ